MIKDVRHTLSAHLFITLGFLGLLFYGNIFLLFKKALRFKNILIRVAIPCVLFCRDLRSRLLPGPTAVRADK